MEVVRPLSSICKGTGTWSGGIRGRDDKGTWSGDIQGRDDRGTWSGGGIRGQEHEFLDDVSTSVLLVEFFITKIACKQ